MQILFNPRKPDFSKLDEKTKKKLLNTIEFFEKKGKKKLKEDELNRVFYDDFLEFQKNEKLFATFMTPKGYGAEDSRWDSYRNCYFSEVLGFYGLAYWYTWQVSMLGLGPLFMSKNEKLKHRTAKYLDEGGIFAFGLSEKEHGADLINSEMMLEDKGNGKYVANGKKYYIGNGNKAALVSTFGKIKGTKNFVFFAVESGHKDYKLIKNVVPSQNYVSEYHLENYEITDDDIIAKGRDAWDASLSTVAFCKYNLGWASVGIATHAFYEAINHASKRKLYGDYVTAFPHIKQLFMDGYLRLVSMKLFTLRASDYMRAASEEDRRYLLYNPMVKMKVTVQGENVIDLIWDVIAAKGFERDMYFETAAREIRGLPKLEGTVHVNMVLINQFMENFLFNSKEYPELPERNDLSDDTFLFNQGATSKGAKTVVFHDYKKAYGLYNTENIKIFLEQVEEFKKFLKETPPSKEQSKDLDFMLSFGEIFTLIPYGQLILERAHILGMDSVLINRIFDVLVRDFSKYAIEVYSKASTTPEQMKNALNLVRKPAPDNGEFEKVLGEYVYSLKDQYEMNP
ncbi:MAG: acyl-CoA dehydrogenase [Leptospiraceae bacterium]|nr:acyl-CoA dehydrogenase [Leptospiraceae bacterium]